jgi:hypothetical protein
MAQAQGSKRQLTYIKESVFGVTPTNPQTTALDFVSFTGNLETPEIQSATVRSNRQVAGARRGNISTKGDLAVEMTPDNVDPLLEAVMQGTWDQNTFDLKVGSNQRSFTIEEGFTDLNVFRKFTGCVFNTLSMDITPDAYVKATFGFMGKDSGLMTETPLSATPTPAGAGEGFFHEGGMFREYGVDVGYLSAISFELNNNAAANNALGVTGVRSITSGKAVVTGTVTGLFEDVNAYNRFANDTETQLQFSIVNAAGRRLEFSFPKVKYTSGAIQAEGDAGVTVQMQFTAVYDDASGTTLQINRV